MNDVLGRVMVVSDIVGFIRSLLRCCCAHRAYYQIQDLTEQDLVNLRRTIYLTIMSSAGFEECAHKLMKLDIREGYEAVRLRC